MEPAAISFANMVYIDIGRYATQCATFFWWKIQIGSAFGIRHSAYCLPIQIAIIFSFILFFSYRFHYISSQSHSHSIHSSNPIRILIDKMNFQRNEKSFRTFSIWNWKNFFCILCVSLACSFPFSASLISLWADPFALFIRRENIFFFFHVKQLRKPSFT